MIHIAKIDKQIHTISSGKYSSFPRKQDGPVYVSFWWWNLLRGCEVALKYDANALRDYRDIQTAYDNWPYNIYNAKYNTCLYIFFSGFKTISRKSKKTND